MPTGCLRVLLGDQLDREGATLRDIDAEHDVVLLAEVVGEASGEGADIRSHKQRTAAFLAAMRHFAAALRSEAIRVRYVALTDSENTQTLVGEVRRACAELQPACVVMTEPGEWRLLNDFKVLSGYLKQQACHLEIREDTHFLVSHSEFARFASTRKTLQMEPFYRQVRKRFGILMQPDGAPEGGQWNLDHDNRRAFKQAPKVPRLPHFERDEIIQEVCEIIETHLPENPGKLDRWIWPVTRAQALTALDDFIEHRLPFFGDFEDAMWSGEPFLYHSLLSVPLNLKLLNPREVVERAVDAYRTGHAPLNAVEGFVRQVIGWREFIRGIYWHEGPGYRHRNHLEAHGHLPDFFWSGEAPLECLREALAPVIAFGYSHHIQRLMVLANFCLIAGVDPRAVGDWFFAMYVDAVDWVTTPNTIGMALYADGGVVGSKPYAASGKYIQRMSNHCANCAFSVNHRHGAGACPYNAFYWDFLLRHETRFAGNPRMALGVRNLAKLDPQERQAIQRTATHYRQTFGITRDPEHVTPQESSTRHLKALPVNIKGCA